MNTFVMRWEVEDITVAWPALLEAVFWEGLPIGLSYTEVVQVSYGRVLLLLHCYRKERL